MKTKLLFFLLLASYINVIAQCTVNNSIDCKCEDNTQTDCDLLPDITVCWQTGMNDSDEYPPGEGLKDSEINYPENWFEINDEVMTMGRIRVGARTPNIGFGPLNLRGADKDGYRWMVCYENGVADTFTVYDPEWDEQSYCPDGSNPKHISWQRVYHKNADGSMDFYEHMVGTMEYHPTHGHMHFDEWTIMSLRIPDPNNMDNPFEWEMVGDGAKVGFCVMDLGNCSSTDAGCRDEETTYNEGALLSQEDFPNYGLGGGSYDCSPISQGISVGYNDTYGSHLDGMFLNIPLCTPNGDYAVVLEVPQVMIESRLDNNYTWFPITLTQQDNFSSIVTPESVSIEGCSGESINLSASLASSNHTYSWSNGENTPSITVESSGEYIVNIDLCNSGNTVEQVFNVELADIDVPNVTPDSTICEGESITLNAVSGENQITWYDENMNVVSSENEYTTPALYDNTMYYASAGITDSVNVGESQHQGNSNYSSGSDAIGFMAFDALNNFTLFSVDVFTNEPGERKFVLMDNTGIVVDEHTEFIGFADDNPQTVVLNFDIPQGNNYLLGTDASINIQNFGGENPQLKRTGQGGELSFPYVIDDIVSINNSTVFVDGYLEDSDGVGDDYTTYYYYFYNWSVSSLNECHMVPVSIKVDCESSIIKKENVSLSIYPNPTNGNVALSLRYGRDYKTNMLLFNPLGQVVYSHDFGKVNAISETYDWSNLSKGIYTIQLTINNQSIFEKVVIQ